MFQDFFDRFYELGSSVKIIVMPAVESKSVLDWSTLIPTMVGGIATILAALLAFGLGYWEDRKNRGDERLRAAAVNAMAGYFKLAESANLVANIKSHIDKSYKAAEDAGLNQSEPFLTVGPSAGLFTEPERLKPQEYSFLMGKEHFDVIGEVLLVKQRAINLNHLFLQYTDMKIDFQKWLCNIESFERKMDGPLAADIIPPEYKLKFDVRGANLNQVIGSIIEHVRHDLLFAETVTNKFILVAHRKFNPHFPKLEFGIDKEARYEVS